MKYCEVDFFLAVPVKRPFWTLGRGKWQFIGFLSTCRSPLVCLSAESLIAICLINCLSSAFIFLLFSNSLSLIHYFFFSLCSVGYESYHNTWNMVTYQTRCCRRRYSMLPTSSTPSVWMRPGRCTFNNLYFKHKRFFPK